MANKAKQAGTNVLLTKISAFTAFFGIFFIGLGWLIGFLNTGVGDAFETIGNVGLLISVSIGGWSYLRKTNLPGPDLVWTIFFFVFVVLAFVGVIQL